MGKQLNRKRIRRLMRLVGIQVLHNKSRTSIPGKGHKIYPYLLRGPDIDRPNNVWAADITYIPMRKGFLYLVAIVDWHSRKVLSWRLSNSMDTHFCIEALSEAFTSILTEAEIRNSMDGKGRWVDNVLVERLWRSLKYEEVYLKAYKSAKQTRASVKT